MEELKLDQEDNSSSFDVQRLITLFVKFSWLLALGLALGLTIAYLINRYTTPIYRIDAKILLDDPRKNANSPQSFIGTGLPQIGSFANQWTLKNEINILQSSSFVERAVEKLNYKYRLIRLGNIKNSEVYGNEPFHIFLKNQIVLKRAKVLNLRYIFLIKQIWQAHLKENSMQVQ